MIRQGGLRKAWPGWSALAGEKVSAPVCPSIINPLTLFTILRLVIPSNRHCSRTFLRSSSLNPIFRSIILISGLGSDLGADTRTHPATVQSTASTNRLFRITDLPPPPARDFLRRHPLLNHNSGLSQQLLRCDQEASRRFRFLRSQTPT